MRQAVEKRRGLVSFNVHNGFGIVSEDEPDDGLPFAEGVNSSLHPFGPGDAILEFEDGIDVVVNRSAFSCDRNEVHN